MGPKGRAMVVVVLAAALGFLAILGGGLSGWGLAAAPDGSPSGGGSAAAGSERLVSVAGEGVVRIRPDLARLQVGVETRAATAQQAQAENARLTQAVVDAVLRLGVAGEDVQTAWLGLSPEYDYSGKSPRLSGYRAFNQVNVTVRDLGRVGRVVDAAVAAGANNVSGVGFGLSDEAAVRRQALGKAVEDARARAEALARAAGVALGEVVSLAEAEAPMPVPVFKRELAMAEGDASSRTVTPVEPGVVEFRARVTAVWALR